MKNLKNLLLLVLIFSSVLLSCDKDDDAAPDNSFTIDSLKLANIKIKDSLQRIIQIREDSLAVAKAKASNTLGSIIFTVSIVDGTNLSLANGRSQSTQGLSGVNVTVAQAGKLTTVTTAVSGQAVFSNMNVGSVAVTVQATGFTNVNFIAVLTKPSSGTSPTYSSTIVPIYATSGTSLANLSGRIFAETDVTNTSYEKLVGKKIIARLNGISIPEFISDNATIQSRGYESVVFTTLTTAAGGYSFSLPAGSSGNPLTYSIDFEQFIADQKTGATTLTRMKYSRPSGSVTVQSEGIYSVDFYYDNVAVDN